MLTCQKHLFSLESGHHYINGAYMSPISKSVEAAGILGLSQKVRPYNVSPIDFFTDVEKLRALFGELVHAKFPQEIALIPSVSYGMAIVAKNLGASKGQNIVVVDAQFPSNVYSWLELAKEQGLEIRSVSYPTVQEGRGALLQQRILEAIDIQTCLVTIETVHWANGTQFNLKELSTRAHEVGALFVLDGTQSVGALPIDVQEMGIDALVCGGYKWLMGAYQLGYAYFNERFTNGKPLEENWITRKDSEDFSSLVNYQEAYQPHSVRYDVGERSNFITVPMGIAALQQLLGWGVQNIQDYCAALTAEAVPLWREKGFWVEQENWRSKHLFGIQLPEHISAQKLQANLKAQNVYVSMRGDFIRISPNVYNNAADIAALTAVLCG
jgi:selenocysteine lyase/cysteine desulfurase